MPQQPYSPQIDLEHIHSLTEKELLVAIAVTLNAACAKIETQNGRIGKLEAWRSYIMGGLAVIGIAVGIIGGYVVSQI